MNVTPRNNLRLDIDEMEYIRRVLMFELGRLTHIVLDEDKMHALCCKLPAGIEKEKRKEDKKNV